MLSRCGLTWRYFLTVDVKQLSERDFYRLWRLVPAELSRRLIGLLLGLLLVSVEAVPTVIVYLRNRGRGIIIVVWSPYRIVP